MRDDEIVLLMRCINGEKLTYKQVVLHTTIDFYVHINNSPNFRRIRAEKGDTFKDVWIYVGPKGVSDDK